MQQLANEDVIAVVVVVAVIDGTWNNPAVDATAAAAKSVDVRDEDASNGTAAAATAAAEGTLSGGWDCCCWNGTMSPPGRKLLLSNELDFSIMFAS